MATVFVTDRPYLPTLMFVDKAGT